MTLLGDDEPLSAGRRHEAKCEVAVVIVMVIIFVVMVMWFGVVMVVVIMIAGVSKSRFIL